MLNLKNTLDGYLKNVEVIGNTIQDVNNLADIRSVGDKVEGQELYKIDVVSCGKNLFDGVVYREGGFYDTDGRWTSSPTIDTYRVRVNPNTTYIKNSYWNGINCYFDKDMNCISGENTHVFTTPDNCYYMSCSINKSIDKNKVQLELGNQVTSYEPYKGDKLEILSPVQLEKVGDVADRIICKDGVWGVEKKIKTVVFNGSEDWALNSQQSKGVTSLFATTYIVDVVHSSVVISDKFIHDVNQYSADTESIKCYSNKNTAIRISKTLADTALGFKTWLASNPVTVKYILELPIFIPLPHDQQVKLRTFAGQTNIAFLTEIPGQIKAQVPKSLGATVNTHTEQIADLHNSLDRVKKLEETTVSTVETESNYTTVDATSNGYFEGVKLEGKTLATVFTCSTNKQYAKWTEVDCVNYKTVEIGKVYTVIGELNNSIKCGLKNETQDYLLALDSSNGSYICKTITFSKTDKLKVVTDIEGLVNMKVIILEGDHTNNPPSYFEGLMSVGQDVEEVSVGSASSGNLLDLSRIVVGKYIANNNVDVEHGTSFYCDKYVKVYPGVKYQLIASDNSKQIGRVSCYNKNGNYISTTEYATNTPIYFDSTVDTIRLSFFDRLHLKDMLYFGTNSNYIGQVIKQDKKPLLYFNPTTETWEKPILREWDTIEKHSDGKYYYHKRSGEVVFNGSEDWLFSSGHSNDATTFFYSNIRTRKPNELGICDTFTQLTDYTNKNLEGIYYGSDINIRINTSKLSTQDVVGFKAWLKANPTTVVYQLAQEEVYECTNIDLMTYSGETNYIINSGAISPKSLLKVHSNISNVVKILQEKVSLLENTFIAGLKSVLSGDMYSLATILYPEDFEQNDNTEQDIMVIPE